MARNAKKLSFLAIFCSAACARLLVHVRCPLKFKVLVLKAPRRHVLTLLDERQITHLICARLKYDLYDFFRGVFGPFVYKKKNREQAPKHP